MDAVKFLFGICCSLAILAGCSAGQKAGEKEQVKEVCLSGIDKQRAVVISEEVLRDFNFSIAKEDANSGYILTRPLPGSQFFEFWRKDNADSYSAAQSSIQSIRRTAELNLSEVNGQICINCAVRKQRLYLSAPPEEKAGLKYDRITGQKIRTTNTGLDTNPKQMSWIDLGNDAKLAAVILKKIEAAALKR
jgi:hypothetical protein